MPHLVPKDGNTDEFMTDDESLFDNNGAVFSHSVHDGQSCILSRYARGLRSYGQRVYESLGVMLSNFGKKVVDVSPDVSAWSLDTGNDLREELQRGIRSNTNSLSPEELLPATYQLQPQRSHWPWPG
jgi:hypothetical protein